MGYVKSGVSVGVGLGTAHGGMNGNGNSVGLHTSQVMQGGATAMHGMAEVVVKTAEDIDTPKPQDINTKPSTSAGSKVLGVLGFPLSAWGAINDGIDARTQSRAASGHFNFGDIKASTALSFTGNALGVVAGVVAIGVATATAPAWAPVVGTIAGLGSLGLGVASLYTSYQHGDLTMSDVYDIVKGTTNQAYQNFSEPFKEFMGKVGDKFLETVLESDKAFKDFVEKVTDIAKNTQSFTDMLSGILEPVAEFARDIAGIKDDDGDYDDAIGKIRKVFEKIGELFDNAKETLSKITEDVLDLPEYLINELGKWLSLNRNGKHYFL